MKKAILLAQSHPNGIFYAFFIFENTFDNIALNKLI